MIGNLLIDIKRVGACACVLAASAAGAFGVWAAETTDLGELKNGVATEYPGGFGVVQATFTVPEDGPVRVTCTGTELYGYTAPEYVQANEWAYEHSYVNGRPMRVYEAKKGDTIYFYNGFVMDAGTITVTSGDVELEMLYTDPSTDPESPYYYGGFYSVSTDYRVHFAFNLPIEIGDARMTVNGAALNLSPDVATTTVEVNVASTLMSLYKSGSLKKGDTVHIELTGVHEKGNADNKLGGTGVAAVDFVMAAEPVQLVSTKNTPDSGTADMLSYYMPGNPASLVQLVFSGDLDADRTPVACLSYGDLDNIDAGMYYENITGQVEGNTVTFDLAGKLRRPQDMLPLLTTPLDYINMSCSGVYGADGQRAYTGEVANPNNYVFNYGLEVLQYNVVADFTPSESKGLEEGKELEIFVMEGDKIDYEGVKFAYAAAGEPAEVVVPKDRCDISFENTTDLVILLDVPALPGIDAGSDVTVTLADMTCADGLDHTDTVKAVYGDYTSGIESVATGDDTEADVYNAQGILVLPGADRSAVGNLPAGLYIMRGKKIIVK